MKENIRMTVAILLIPIILIALGSNSQAIGGMCIAGIGWFILIVDLGWLLLTITGLSVGAFFEWLNDLFQE